MLLYRLSFLSHAELLIGILLWAREEQMRDGYIERMRIEQGREEEEEEGDEDKKKNWKKKKFPFFFIFNLFF